ncbi:hypothetical protein D3C81_1424390 [compost metagenome]
MRDARHQRAQRGQLVAAHQFFLRDGQVFQRGGQFAVRLFRLFLGLRQGRRAFGHQLFQVGAVALQLAFVAHAANRDAGQVGRRVDQLQVARIGLAHFAVVHGERAEHGAILAEDGLRPAGAQAERRGQFAVGRPQRIAHDVADHHRFAQGHGRAARAYAGADGHAFEQGHVFGRQAGAGRAVHVDAVVVEQHDGAEHAARLAFD